MDVGRRSTVDDGGERPTGLWEADEDVYADMPSLCRLETDMEYGGGRRLRGQRHVR